MLPSMTVLPSMTPGARRRPATGLLYLVTSGLLWGTGGLTGSVLSRVSGLSATAVAAGRLTAGGVLIVVFLAVTGRPWPAGRVLDQRLNAAGIVGAAILMVAVIVTVCGAG